MVLFILEMVRLMIPVPPPEVIQSWDGGYWIFIAKGTPNECKTWVSSMHLVDDHIGQLERSYRLKQAAGTSLQAVYDEAQEVFHSPRSQ